MSQGRRVREPFRGELMVCCLCGREEWHEPGKESSWHAILFNQGGYRYVCPEQMPPDGASEADLALARAHVQKHVSEDSPCLDPWPAFRAAVH